MIEAMLGSMFHPGDFPDTGIVELPGAFGPEEADAMRAAIWQYVEQRCSFRADDPSTWSGGRLPPGLSLKALKGRAVFAPVRRSQALTEVLDAIFGSGRWAAPGRGVRILLTFPERRVWTLPTGWHIDASFDRPTFPVPWVQLWALLDRVEPCGGGTLLLAGSHRLVERYARDLPGDQRGGNAVNWGRFMRQHPFLDQLRRGGRPEAPGRELLGDEHDIDGVRVQPIELSGGPGDMFLSHGQVFHCASANTGDRPRQMLTGAVKAA